MHGERLVPDKVGDQPAIACNAVAGEIETPIEDVSAVCSRCGSRTPHRRGADGVLRCKRCMFDVSVPEPIQLDRRPTESDAPLEPLRSRWPALVLGSLFFVMIAAMIGKTAC